MLMWFILFQALFVLSDLANGIYQKTLNLMEVKNLILLRFVWPVSNV